MDSLFDGASGKLYESGRVGTRKVVGAIGLGRGFGSVDGAGTTDRVATSLSGSAGKRTYFVLAKVNGWGGGNFGRLFDASAEEIFYFRSVEGLTYSRAYSVGVRSAISNSAASVSDTFGKIASFSVSFDASSYTNKPELYINGIRFPFVTIDGVPSGSITAASNLIVGNRADATRNFDGVIYDFLQFDRMLLPVEHARLHAMSTKLYRRRKVYLSPVAAVQTARPIADLSNTGWSPSSGADLYPMVGETVRDDASYIKANFVGALCELDLADLADPAVSTGHLPTLVLSAPGGGGITVRLRQGTTTIAEWTYYPASTPTEYSPALSGAEADSITDYTALRLQFEAIA